MKTILDLTDTPDVSAAALAMVGDRTVLVRNLDWLASHGADRIWIAVRAADADAIRGALPAQDPPIVVAVADDRGSAGVLHVLDDSLSGEPESDSEAPIVVLDGARLYDFDLGAACRDHATTPAIATITAHPVVGLPASSGERRLEVDRTGRVLRIARAELAGDLDLEPAGCVILEPGLLEHVPTDQPSELLVDLFPMVLQKGGILGGHRIDGRVFSLDTPELVAAATVAVSD